VLPNLVITVLIAMPVRTNARVEAVSFGSPRFRSVEAGGLLVTHAAFPADQYLRPHVHDRTCVAITLDGAFDSRMRGRSYWSTASMLLSEPAGERHDNRFGPGGARIVIVQPDAKRMELLRPVARFLDSVSHRTDPAVALLARRLSVETGASDGVAPLAVEGLALELLATAARAFEPARDPAPGWLARVRDRLHDGFADSPTLAELAALAGVHPGHLTRAFRRHYGRSIGAYLRGRRLDWAAERLAVSDEPLAAIAASAGFADQSHFTRLFRMRFRCTPAVYRARVRLA
jgi:AraC family transcriptional regulator